MALVLNDVVTLVLTSTSSNRMSAAGSSDVKLRGYEPVNYGELNLRERADDDSDHA